MYPKMQRITLHLLPVRTTALGEAIIQELGIPSQQMS